MIPDSQTNFIYLADTLDKKHPIFYNNFQKELIRHGINFGLLPQTKDIWAVDYMPIQVNLNEFVQFVYHPSYLTKYKKYAKTISDTDAICSMIDINTIKSNIILDGGNITRCENTVIMTERVFIDNSHYEKNALINKLYELFQANNIFFIPEHPDDFTGHSDGMLRFLDEHTIIINDYKRERKSFCKAFDSSIKRTGLNYVKIPYNVYSNKSIEQANGEYINYLHVGKTIILPIFELPEDDSVLEQFSQLFPHYNISAINSNEIANYGGVLNCITWNIKL